MGENPAIFKKFCQYDSIPERGLIGKVMKNAHSLRAKSTCHQRERWHNRNRMTSPHSRRVGVLLPLFSARREGDLGIGDTLALAEWIRWAAAHEVGFLQLLPINQTGSDDSPYNAISSVALEPLYLTMAEADVPGLVEADLIAAREMLGPEVIQARLVDYKAVRSCKNDLLRKAFTRFIAGKFFIEKVELQQFYDEQSAWLDDYTLFRWLMDAAGGSECWDLWPEAFRTPAKARAFFLEQQGQRGDAVREEIQFHAWVQWLCFRQWRAVRTLADEVGVQLMGDIPIGISYHSADVFFQSEQFDLEWFGGAPPETMFKHDRFIQQWGQNWGVPLYRWDLMESQGYPWWKQRIHKLTEIFHVFRIDHILGFYRMYAFPWRPTRNDEFLDLSADEAQKRTGGRLPRWAWRDDETAENRRANLDEGDRRLRMVIEAASGGEVVGEDLGCVPDYVRPHLESLGIAGFRIPHWDSDQGHVVDGSRYPECSFATFATHDHDTIAALWESFRLSAMGATASGAEQSTAQWSLRLLAEFGGMDIDVENPPPFDHEIQWRLLDALLACHSRYAALMITDLFGMIDRYNKPGTVDKENWSYRLPFTLEEMEQDPEKQRDVQRLSAAIRHFRPRHS